MPANYRAACIASTRAVFVHKLAVVEEEADESVFWIDMSAEAGLVRRQRVEDLMREGEEILRIVIQSRKTAKSGRK